MEKISINKNILLFLFSVITFYFNAILLLICSAIIDSIFNITYLLIYTLLIFIILQSLSYLKCKKFVKKYEKFILLDELTFEYREPKTINNFKINKLDIDKIKFSKYVRGKFKPTTLILKDKTTRLLSLPIKVIYALADKLQIDIEIRNKKKIKSYFFRDLKEYVSMNKIKIFLIFLGIVFTFISFYLDNLNNNFLSIKIVISIIDVIFGMIILDNVFIKNKWEDKLSRILLTILFFIIFSLIQFVVIVLIELVMLKQSMTLSYMFYSFYLFPSFLPIILIFIFLLISLSYA